MYRQTVDIGYYPNSEKRGFVGIDDGLFKRNVVK
jgi:hypothetical protein